jgi:methylated-DNA-protein-cysteine methyltransferase-like protein
MRSSLLCFLFPAHSFFNYISSAFFLASFSRLFFAHFIQHGFSQRVAATPRLRAKRNAPIISLAMSGWDPVYNLVKRIPRGRVTTYGALAKSLRLRGGARTAGRAMAGCPSGKGIPWHRVVGAGGKLLIREPYSLMQRKLLESEGVPVLECRVRIKDCLWTPPKPERAARKSPK